MAGPATATAFPIALCTLGGSGEADGGGGYDALRVGIGSFDGISSDFVVEAAAAPGYDGQVRSLTTGEILNFRSIEEIRFRDVTLSAPYF